MNTKTILIVILCIAMAVWSYIALTEISTMSADLEGMATAPSPDDPLIAQTRMEMIRTGEETRQSTMLIYGASVLVFIAALFGISRIGRKKDADDS